MKLRKRGQKIQQHLVKVRACGRWQPKEILPLANPDDHTDASGEPCDDGRWNESQNTSESCDAE